MKNSKKNYNNEKLEHSEKNKRINTWKYWKLTPLTSVDERNNKKGYLKRMRRQLETKLYGRNLIKGINTWEVDQGRPQKRPREEENRWWCIRPYILEMTMTDYVWRQERGRRLNRIKDSDEESIQRLEDDIEKHGGRLIIASRSNTDDTRTNRITITRKQKWEGKHLNGHIKWLTSDISHADGSPKQRHQDISFQRRIDKTQQNSRCWLCGDSDETNNHIMTKCSK